MSRFTLSRRTFLKGLAGGALASVALPPLEAMLDSHGEGYADGGPLPCRFVTFFFGNGILNPLWIPTNEGSDYPLPVLLEPLADLRDQIAMVTGFENKIRPAITHHEGMAGMWSGHPFDSSGGLYSSFGGPSIDQVVADHIGADTYLRSIEIGVSKRTSNGQGAAPDEGPTMRYISHRAGDQPNPPEYSPRALFKRMFGQFVPPDDPSGSLRINVLDAVNEDARALKMRVGANDRQRLDAHLTSIAQLQQQIAELPPVCTTPTEPVETNQDIAGQEPLPEVAKAMADLLVYAFRCDLSRVASYMLSPGVGWCTYTHLGHSTELHTMSHAPATYQTEFRDSIRWNVEQYAYLLQALRDTPEGARTLLDNSVVLLGSDCGEGWNHSLTEMPVIVAGGGAGRLQSGTHLRSTNQRNLSDILLTAMQAAAPEVAQVGSGTGFSNSPVSELLNL